MAPWSLESRQHLHDKHIEVMPAKSGSPTEEITIPRPTGEADLTDPYTEVVSPTSQTRPQDPSSPSPMGARGYTPATVASGLHNKRSIYHKTLAGGEVVNDSKEVLEPSSRPTSTVQHVLETDASQPELQGEHDLHKDVSSAT
jgi:hypothetical protein